MTTLIRSTNQTVTDAVDDATKAACDVLDRVFPGFDAGGITSNFQSLLSEVITHMLKGRSMLDGGRGHFVSLPALIVDESLFGNPLMRGEQFLITKQTGSGLVALEPGRSCMQPLDHCTKAWSSFQEAADAAFDYCLGQSMSLEAVKDSMLMIKPVVERHGADGGFMLYAG